MLIITVELEVEKPNPKPNREQVAALERALLLPLVSTFNTKSQLGSAKVGINWSFCLLLEQKKKKLFILEPGSVDV